MFQEISRIHFFKFKKIFLRDKPYNIEMRVKFVMSTNEHVMMNLRPTLITGHSESLCHPTYLLIYEQQTGGLPRVQCTKNGLTRKNCIANYKISQEHQPKSRRFPVFQGAFQIQEILRSCRHSDPAHAAGPNNNHISKWTTKVRENN